MKEAQGTTWVFGLMVSFIFLFTSFLILALNYSDVFKMKNEAVGILEKFEGYTDSSETILNNYLLNSGYNNKGICPEGFYGANLDGTGDGPDGTSGTYNYCIRRNKKYYDVVLFYKFNLPVIGDILTFKIMGETKDIIFGNSNLYIW